MGASGAAAGWLKAAIRSLKAFDLDATGGGAFFTGVGAGSAGSAAVGFGAGGGSAFTTVGVTSTGGGCGLEYCGPSYSDGR